VVESTATQINLYFAFFLSPLSNSALPARGQHCTSAPHIDLPVMAILTE
jgi:hypothetical protein